MLSQSLTYKIVFQGIIADVFVYEKDPRPSEIMRYSNKISNYKKIYTKEEILNKSNYRRLKNFRELVNSNFIFKTFLTLTFRENLTNRKLALIYFRDFIKRLNYYCNKKISYICVPEFQKRGAIHFHLLLDLRYLPSNIISDLWKHGFIKIHSIRSNYDIGFYLGKYLTKNLINNCKAYFSSKGLLRPIIIYIKSFNALLSAIFNDFLIYTKNFYSYYTGFSNLFIFRLSINYNIDIINFFNS